MSYATKRQAEAIQKASGAFSFREDIVFFLMKNLTILKVF